MTRNVRLTLMLRSICGVDIKEYTVTDIAKRLRVSRPALSNLLNGRSELSIEMACRIEDVFGYSALALLDEQTRCQYKQYRDSTVSDIFPTNPYPISSLWS